MSAETFKVGLFDELEAIYPDTDPACGASEYHIAAAKGTYAGVHIMLSGLTPGIPVTFEARGPHGKTRFFELIPVPVEDNSGLYERTELMDGKYNPYTIRRAPFMVYEVLRPFRNILTACGASMAAAFRCRMEADKHEFQRWEINISHNGIMRSVSLVVEAFSVEVPKASADQHKYVNWISLDNIALYHHVSMWSKEWESLVEKYFRLANYGRQNMVCLWPQFYFDVNENNKPVLNEKKLDKLVELCDKAGIYWLQGGTMGERKDGEWLASEAVVSINKDPIPGEGEKTLHDMSGALYKYLVSRNLDRRWIQSFFDEPLDVSSSVYRLGTSIIRSAMPGIQIVEANKSRETIIGALDIWCPTLDRYELNKEFFDERKNAGDHIWVYTCLTPCGPYCNRLLDMERLRQVWIGWAPAKYDIEGFLHWGGNWPGGHNPYCQSAAAMGEEFGYNFDISYNMQLPAGDNILFYPGFLEPLSCTRLEAHRIGFEDLCLLEVVKNKSPKLAEEIIDSVFRGYTNYEKDVSKYRDVKRRLLTAASGEGTSPHSW